MPPLRCGDIVRMKPNDKKKEWQKACVEGKTNIRSYMVKTENGGSYRRNRAHLRRINKNFSTPIQVEHPDTVFEHESQNNCPKDQEPQIMSTAPDSHPDPDLNRTSDTIRDHLQSNMHQKPSRTTIKPARFRDPDFVYD